MTSTTMRRPSSRQDGRAHEVTGAWPGRRLPEVLYAVLYMAATRTQIYLTREQRRKLDARRKRDRKTLAAVVRDAIDAYLAERPLDVQEVLDRTFGSIPDLEVPSRDEWEARARRLGV